MAVARTLVSAARLAERAPVAEVKPVIALASETDTDATDAPRVLASADNPELMLASATESDTAAELSADTTDVIALVRLRTSADSALEAVVTTAITLAICAKLGLAFNSCAISCNVSRLPGALPFMADSSAFNVLVAAYISAEIAVESADAAAVNDGTATPNPAEMDST
jgi:hypothetical protein